MEKNNFTGAVYARIDHEFNPDAKGQYILFGFYPQSRICDEALIKVLNILAGKLPTDGNNEAWTSYKYYIFDNNDKDFMWYQDVSHDDVIYRGVYFTEYRPNDTFNMSEDNFQEKNGYHTRTVYWFKHEPIKWEILEEHNGKARIITTASIDSQAYRNIVWDNSYVNSSIRIWLNNDFINAAFDEYEREAISPERVTNPIEAEEDYESGEIKYGGGDTFECIHLLSVDEVAELIPAGQRKCKATDYAVCQGISINTATGYSVWWLRSPYKSVNAWAQLVGTNGFGDFSTGETGNTDTGVRPALWLKL